LFWPFVLGVLVLFWGLVKLFLSTRNHRILPCYYN
jgi:hypothetical protein